MFSDGLLAQTVDKVVSEGAAYFSSAGNNGLEAYQASYDPVSMARARQLVAQGKENIDIDSLAAHGLPAKSFHKFRNRDGSESFTQRFTSYFGDVVDFQWDEPFDLGKVKTDYNIYVFDADGHFIDPNDPTSDAFFTSDDNTATDQALELMAVNPGTYQIVIAKVNDGPARRLKYVTVNGTGESEIQNAPSVWGHTAARRGQSVGGDVLGHHAVPGGLQLARARHHLLRQARAPARRARGARRAADHRGRRRGHDLLPAGRRHRRQRPPELLRHQRRRARRSRGRRAGHPVGRRPGAHQARGRLRAAAAKPRRRFRCHETARSRPPSPDRLSPQRTATSRARRTTGRSRSSRSPTRR